MTQPEPQPLTPEEECDYRRTTDISSDGAVMDVGQVAARARPPVDPHAHGDQPCDPSEAAAIRQFEMEAMHDPQQWYAAFETVTGEVAVSPEGKAAIYERFRSALSGGLPVPPPARGRGTRGAAAGHR